MKLLQSIKNLTNKFTKKSIVIASVLAVGAGLSFGAVQAEFYPNRQPFDYSKACNPNDTDIYDRCGSLTGPVFNSFINTPSYGDERSFVDARRTDQTAAGSYKDVLPDVTAGAQEVVIRTYVHNNANQSTNASGLGIAKDAKVRIALPTATSNVLRARGFISASNASLVEDTVDFTAPGNFRVEYIPGSAIIYNNGAFKDGQTLSDSIVTSGAPIGYDKLDGNLPGCFDYEAVVQIKIRIVPVEEPKIDFSKQVRIKGTKEWKQEVAAKPGDNVEWLLTTQVKGGQQMDAISVRDVAAPNTELVPNTVKRIDASRNQVLSNEPLFGNGYNLGSYAAGSGFYVMFESKVLGTFEGCEARVRNQAFVTSTQQTTPIKGTADVVIKKENCTPPPVATVVCTNLTAPSLSLKVGDKTTFTATATATNTTIRNYIFSVNGAEVQRSANSTYEFTRNNAGQFVVTVSVEGANGQVVTSDTCVKTVNVTEEPKVVCESLDATKLSLKKGEKSVFSAKASAKNATITGYIFTVDGREVQNDSKNTFSYTSTTAGTFKVAVTVKSTAGNVTSDACMKNIDVMEEIKPIYRCDSFTLSKRTAAIGEEITITVRISARDGAEFKLATFTFGDEANGNNKFVTNSVSNGVITTKHVYTKAGDYAPRVKLDFTVNGEAKIVEDATCAGQITVTKQEVKGTTTPVALPSTGAGSIAGAMAAITAIGTVAHRKLTLRRK